MAVYSLNRSKRVIMSKEEAITILNDNDAKILSNIVFEQVDTIAVRIMMTRLQAGAGLIAVEKLLIFIKLLIIKAIVTTILQFPVAMKVQ